MEGKTAKIVILVVIVAIIAMVIGLVASSLKKLDSFEVGLQYDTIQKKLGTDVKNEGLHLGPVGYEMIVFPNVFESVTMSEECLNHDGVTIGISVSYQYRVRSRDLYSLVTQFKDHETYVEVLKSAGVAGLQVMCSNFSTEAFQTNRAGFQSALKDELQIRCSALSCDVNDVQVNDITRPYSYENAIRSKQAAAENVAVVTGQRDKELTKANTTLREAETQKDITLEAALSRARILDYQADTEATAIIDRYTKEASSYSSVATNLSLDIEGLISYIGTRTLEKNPNPVYVSVKSPAISSYATP